MKISGIQIFWMMFTFVTGNAILITVSPAILSAKQDAWISYVIATVLGILIVFIATKVSLLYPNQTLIEFSKSILGKWLGGIIVIPYLIQWYSLIGLILRQFADFTITIMLPSTPMWVLVLTMLMLMIYVIYIGGIEGVGRCSEVFGPMVLLMVVILVILSIPNMEIKRILPVYADSGWHQIFKGALYPLTFLGESVMMMMLVSFMGQPKQSKPWAIWGIGLSGFFTGLVTLIVLMVFGPAIAAKMNYPAFNAFNFISMMDFIQNLEIISVLIWILSVFIKLSLYLFLASYGTAQLFNIKDWRKTIWLVAIVSFFLAMIYPNVLISVAEYNNKYWLPFVLPINMVGIPLLLWIVGSIRKRSNNSRTV